MTENTFGVISSTFVKTIHVELPDKGVYFAMPEVFRQHYLLKLTDIPNDEFSA
jgi:hypothetical protein